MIKEQRKPEARAKAKPVGGRICMLVVGSVASDERVWREASALQREGYQVTIIDLIARGQGPRWEVMRGSRVWHMRLAADFARTRFKKHTWYRVASVVVQSLWRLLMTRADVYHAHDLSALPACYVAAVVWGKALVFDAHELPLAEVRIERPWLDELVQRAVKKMIERCAAVITVSMPIAQEIRRRYHPTQIALVRNMLAYRPYVPSDRLRQALQLPANTRIALYQGNIQADRHPELLVQVARLLEPQHVLVLLGKGIGDTVARLEEMIKGEGVGERIKILPPVNYAELLEWTASADVGLILYEPEHSLNVKMCLPNKLFEYLMAGLPVLATALEAVGELLTSYGVGQVVTSMQPERIAEALNQMLADEAGLTAMRIHALAAVREELCWEREQQHLIYLYHEIVAVPPSVVETV